MNPFVEAILFPVLEITTIIAFLAMVFGAVYFLIERTEIGANIKAWTPWMGWELEYKDEENYTNFKIHPANYIRVPR